MPTLEHVGELAFIEAIARLEQTSARGVAVGIGDDAAVLACRDATLVTTDTQREGVHFRHDWLTPRQLGRRAFRVAVSDISAMGGAPRYVLLSFGAPPELDARTARRIVEGLVEDAHACGAALVGGNVSRDERVSLVVTVLGDAPYGVLLRSGASEGDGVWVSGALGDAAAGVELLEAGVRRGRLVDAYRTPPLRIELAQALAHCKMATSMIDVSDGLVHDLAHVCRASGVTVEIDPGAVPVSRGLRDAVARGVRTVRAESEPPESAAPVRPLRRDAREYALGGGDAYELVFTMRRDVADDAVRRLCEKHGTSAVRIGVVVERRKAEIVDRSGRPLRVEGYTHFRETK